MLRKAGPLDPVQAANGQFAHPVALNGSSAGDKEMAQGYQGQVGIDILAHPVGASGRPAGNGSGSLRAPAVPSPPGIRRQRPGGCHDHAKKGTAHTRSSGCPSGSRNRRIFFVRTIAGHADHMDVQLAQQFARGLQQGGRIVVAADDDHMAAGGTGQPMEEAVIEGLGPAPRSGGIKHVTRHQQGVDGLASISPPASRESGRAPRDAAARESDGPGANPRCESAASPWSRG
jgi:hypothetical protein